MRGLIVRIYDRLLRLYPRRFREVFADEMRDVFAQAVHNVRPFHLAVLCARELREMPASLIREHLRERWAVTVAMSPGYTFTYRFYVLSILTGVILYLTLIILPFFAYGLHLEDPGWVGGGSFDPKGLAIFANPVGCWLRLLGITTLVLLPVWNTFFGLRLLFSLGWNWLRLLPGQRRLGFMAIVIGAALVGFIFSPAGRLIMRWYMD